MDKKELIFNLHKDEVINDCSKFKNEISKQYNLNKKDSHDVYAKIINYQLDKYGGQINNFITIEDFKTKYFEANRKIIQSRYYRRNKR